MNSKSSQLPPWFSFSDKMFEDARSNQSKNFKYLLLAISISPKFVKKTHILSLLKRWRGGGVWKLCNRKHRLRSRYHRELAPGSRICLSKNNVTCIASNYSPFVISFVENKLSNFQQEENRRYIYL